MGSAVGVQGTLGSGPGAQCVPSSSTASEENGHQPLLADFSGSSFLELKGLHTFERDLGSVGQKGGERQRPPASVQTPPDGPM